MARPKKETEQKVKNLIMLRLTDTQRDLQTIYTNVRKMLGLDDDRKTAHTVDKGLG